MIQTETKFAYRHKPTGKWCHIDYFFDNELWENDLYPYVHELQLVDNLTDATFNNYEPALTSDLKLSNTNVKKYAVLDFHEFELVEIEIEYKIKEEYQEIKVYRNFTGWPDTFRFEKI